MTVNWKCAQNVGYLLFNMACYKPSMEPRKTWSIGDRGFEAPLVHTFSLWSHLNRIDAD